MTLINDTGLGLAKRMLMARVGADLEQAQIAKLLGVARTTVSAWETGRTEPSATNFVMWAKITGQPLEWLAAGVNAESPSTEVEGDSSLSQHSVRHKGLEPLTFCFGDTSPFWTPERALSLASLWCQVEPDAEIAPLVGVE